MTVNCIRKHFYCYDSFEAVTFLYYTFLCRLEKKTHHKLQKLWTHPAQPLCRQGRGKERYKNRQYRVLYLSCTLPQCSRRSVSQSAASVTWSDLIEAILCRKQQLSYFLEINTLCNHVVVLKQMASAVWSCSWPWIQLHLRQRNFLFVYTMKNPGSSHINEVELDQCSTQHSLVPFNPSLPSFLCVWLQVKPGWSPTWMFHLLKLQGRNVCSHTHKHCVDNSNTDTL